MPYAITYISNKEKNFYVSWASNYFLYSWHKNTKHFYIMIFMHVGLYDIKLILKSRFVFCGEVLQTAYQQKEKFH